MRIFLTISTAFYSVDRFLSVNLIGVYMYSVRHVYVCLPLSYEFTSCHVFEYFIFSFVVKFMINLQFSVCCNILEYHSQVHNNLLFSVYIVIYLSPYLNLLIMFIVVFFIWMIFIPRKVFHAQKLLLFMFCM